MAQVWQGADLYAVNNFPIYLYVDHRFYRVSMIKSSTEETYSALPIADAETESLDKLLEPYSLNKDIRLPEYDTPGMNTTYDGNKWIYNAVEEIIERAESIRDAEVLAAVIGKVKPNSDHPADFWMPELIRGVISAVKSGEIPKSMVLGQSGGKGFFYGRHTGIKNYSALKMVSDAVPF